MVFWRKKKDAGGGDGIDEIARPENEPAAPEEISLEELNELPLPEAQKEEGGWFSRLTKGLSKSSTKLTQGLAGLVTKKKLDQSMLDELEDLLITADLGPKTAARLVGEFGRDRFGKDISEEEIKEALAESIAKILEPVAKPLPSSPRPLAGGGTEGGGSLSPFVVLVCGVNGVGKTTTIGKIAYGLNVSHKRPVMIAAGDTFRAAAIEQLEIWAQRANAPIIKKELGADAAAVAYEAYEKAKAAGTEVLFIDTAGRLHNKANLMAELQKIVRVLKKQDESLPHAVLLVLDATTGQNAHEQVRVFREMVNVTGLIVTKLDGSAKGGVVVGLADTFGLPIHLIGVGEKIGDLQPFDAKDFARSLVGLD